MGVLDVFRSASRDPSEATLMARGVAALAVVAAVVAALYVYGQGAFADRWQAAAVVDTAGGSLVTGSDVKYDGVIVGKVAGLGFDRTKAAGVRRVRVGLSLYPHLAEAVPGDVKARVLPASVFGTSFVDLVASGGTGGGSGSLRPGAEIPQDRSRETLELQTVLDGLDSVVSALGPAELSRTLEGLAGALDGNGEQLGRTITLLEHYLGRLNPAMPAVRRNLDLLATNLEAFQRYAPDLFAATDDALVAARTVVDQEDDLRGLSRAGARTMGDVDRLLTDNEQRLVDALVRTAVTVDVLYDGRRPLTRGVLSLLDLSEEFSAALSHGRFLRIDGNLVLQEERPYGPGDCPQYGSQRGRGC